MRSTTDAAGPVLDWDEALERLGGRESLLRNVAAVFLDDMPEARDRIERALAAGSQREAAVAAHGLKGSAAALGAAPVADRSKGLELLADGGDLEAAREVWADLQVLLDQLEVALRGRLEG